MGASTFNDSKCIFTPLLREVRCRKDAHCGACDVYHERSPDNIQPASIIAAINMMEPASSK